MADLEPTPQEPVISNPELEEKQDENPSGGDEDQNQSETNETSVQNEKNDKLKEKSNKRGGNRFEPYSTNRNARFRVFVSNIPFEMKWQTLKDIMREKVGEVTYVELFMDADGKSRGCGVVEFKSEENMKKAVEVMDKQSFSGRPLKVKEDLDGEHARRMMQKFGGFDRMGMGGGGGGGGPGMNIPPALLHNSQVPRDVLNALQAGRLGSTIFIVNLDFKVGWKKLKEVFSMAGSVVRADIVEDKDGKSRGMGTVTFERPIESVQAISMFNGQLLFDRPMHIKMDDKSMPKNNFYGADRTPQLPKGLGGVGMGLGPGGQPLDARDLNAGMGNAGPRDMGPGMGGMGMDGMGFGGMNRMGGGGMDGPYGGGGGGMDRMDNMGRFGPGMNMGRMGGSGGMDDYRGPVGGGGMGGGMGDMYQGGMYGPGSGGGMGGSGFDRDFGRNDMGMSRGYGDSFGGGMAGGMSGGMAAGTPGMGSGMGIGMGAMNKMGGGIGMDNMDRMGPGMDRMGGAMDRTGLGMDRIGSNMGSGMTSNVDRMGPGMDWMGQSTDRMGGGMDRMGSGMAGGFDKPADMDRNRFSGNYGGSMGTGTGNLNSRRICQIFVRNLPYDITWQMLKDKFSEFGYVHYADIKMENGKSKGCGVVRFESPDSAERACRMMNGIRLYGREIDVRLDRNV
ncbi:heterogeneous nuclear ribonucleoprotein M-like isoform X1 [Carcharodon carcharias]|uniref:heterogeneous nuclear ribonucleoprotein M-like isoform X1 n=2 Tax=Carcharodon carcharias TaxID=13397 RepID=UPI001B7E143C|nr:heterogeneous nuclear ribonucleoprotein M-like isoform X1 [Carcharodon carcharias]XP_041060057.1 heterogeneous nuclear ribonucleoprotein M-like isoform X1 [Carcharodon carcharias]